MMKTEIIKADLTKPLEAQLARAAELIKNGGLVAFPTETVYGLGASALDRNAAKNIYAAKGRPSDNPLIIHIASPEDAEQYAYTTPVYYRIAEAFMPGPITVILKKKPCVPDEVTGGRDTVAVRCPENPVARALIRLSGVAVAAPSANLSGKPSPTKAEHVISDLDSRIDMIIDGGESDIGLESTIVIAADEGVTVLRPGAVTGEMLADVCGNVSYDACTVSKADDKTPPLAPGMKYRHYAPKAKVVLIRGDGEDFDTRAAAFLTDKLLTEPRTGVICCDELKELLDKSAPDRTLVRNTGKKDDFKAHAHCLFDTLLYFDTTDAERIYAVSDKRTGLGTAIYNRMLKASGYTVIDI